MPPSTAPHNLPRICVALNGDTMPERAAELAPHFPFLEFRLDTAADPHEALFAMGAAIRKHPALRVIATCRRTSNGGHFHGTAADELEMLRQAIAVGAHIVDLSLETAEESAINPHALTPLRRGRNALLLSWHDFHSTPPLRPVLERMRRISADLYKVVPTANTLTDSFALLDLLETESSRGDLVAMSMGVPGIPTRVLGPRFGSVFTFAAVTTGSETAPGQIDAQTLRDLYRIDAITNNTEIYGVFGNPITGSRSPVMLNTAFRQTGRNAVYLPLETDSADELFATWERLCLTGASVTMPLKEQILPRITNLTEQARELGAANTLKRESITAAADGDSFKRDDAISGANTDVLGILAPLEQRLKLAGKSALVLGAGGVARAAVFALRQRGCEVTVCNRTPERAKRLARQLGAAVLAPSDLAGRAFDLVLNGTPFGMPSAVMPPPIDFAATRCGLFFDLVYNPLETPLIHAARAHGIPAILGIEMFLAQGAAQFELWTGSPAPHEAMLSAVRSSLQSLSTGANRLQEPRRL